MNQRDPLAAGLDIGTTATKCMVVDMEGTVVAEDRFATPWVQSRSGRELDGGVLVDQVKSLVTGTLEAAEKLRHGSRVGALGITSMGQSGAFVDTRSGDCLTPVISWDDRRTAPFSDRLESEIGQERFARIAGLPIDPSWSLCRLRQLHDEGFRPPRGAVWLGMADLAAFALTGCPRAEYSLACQSGLVDVLDAEWSPLLADWTGYGRTVLPAIGPSTEQVGRAASVGFDQTAVFIAGHDHAVACAGVGALDPDVMFDSCGTAETLVRSIPAGVSRDDLASMVEQGLMVGRHVLDSHLAVTASQGTTRALMRVADAAGIDFRSLSDHQCPSTPEVELPNPLVSDVTGEVLQGDLKQIWCAANGAVADSALEMAQRLERACGPARCTVMAGGWRTHRPFTDARRQRMPGFEIYLGPEAGPFGAALGAARSAGLGTVSPQSNRETAS
ncbi:FGGY family carbohydrate kinase [Cucumibacter marinus]|uniref:FGGY family carbohydrate kinase n=1 Tax=Cucumibacter marinus TaxID=1121252 RepID=UPI000410FB67|nr:FGGY family carbohydrate kinase [Cucumibacter marinus]